MSTLWLPFSSLLEPPLTLKIELPYKREHDFHSSSKPQNDAFGCHFHVILKFFKQEILTILTLGSSCTSLGPLLHAFSSPSLLWQSPWEHFGASEATLASPAAPFGAKTPPKVTLKWTSHRKSYHRPKASNARFQNSLKSNLSLPLELKILIETSLHNKALRIFLE